MIKEKVSAAVVATVLCMTMAGCDAGRQESSVSPDEGVGGSLVVCLQKTEGFPKVAGSFCYDEVSQGQQEDAMLNVVVIDGDPYLVMQNAFKLGSDKANETNRREENASQLSNAAALLDSAPGKTDEVAVIEALVLADRQHATSGSKGTTVVCSSGLATAGVLSLADTGAVVEADTAVAHLEANGFKLANTGKVIWYGLGDVSGGQEKPSPAVVAAMRLMYEEALRSLGVIEVVFKSDVLPVIDEAQVASSSTVEVVGVGQLSIEAEKVGEVLISSAQMPFIAGTANLVDPESARQLLLPIAQAAAADPSLTVTVAGSTASYPWDKGFAYELGLARAETVRKLILELDSRIEPAKVVASSFGDEAPNHVDDIDEATGLQVPALAQRNRWVSVAID